MKANQILLVALTLVLMAACTNDGKQRNNQTTTTHTFDNAATAVAIQHYICPNSCAGSGGDNPGTCPTCGSEYLHNDAYHTQGPGAQAQPQMPQQQQQPQIQMQQPQMPQPQEPAQNAAGVYHYICERGCAGGGGSAGTCATCGNPLVHNAAYHQ